jgi:hypothetical protein
MRKLVIILLFLSAARTLVSCCEEKGYNFRWSNVKAANISISADRPFLLASDSVQVASYGFRLSFQDERIAYNTLSIIAANKANAYTCVSYFENRDSIQSIDVVTRYDLNNTYSAGSSISEVLQARPSSFYEYEPQYQYVPLNENRHFLNRNQDRSIRNNSIDIKFGDVVPSKGAHRFIVTVSFKSGRVLTDSTSVMLF